MSLLPRFTSISGYCSIGTPVFGATRVSWSLLRRAAR